MHIQSVCQVNSKPIFGRHVRHSVRILFIAQRLGPMPSARQFDLAGPRACSARWRHVHRNHQTVLDDVPQSDPAAFLRQIQAECFHLGLVLVVVMIHSHYIKARSQYAG